MELKNLERALIPINHPEMGSTHIKRLTRQNESATDASVAKLAYDLWLIRGCPLGSSEEDWYQAERILSATAKSIGGSANEPASSATTARGSKTRAAGS